VIGVIVVGIVFVGGVAGILLSSGGSSGPVAGAGTDAIPAAASALAPTGEVNGMGLPVVETPGFTSGITQAGGVTVQGSDWAMGQVPLNVAVRPFWTLTNTGNAKVRLGQPQAQVREGCCPGPFAIGRSTLAPGQSTVLTFELSMHEGMDGWHDMVVYVPVSGAGGEQWLHLNVTGDFRN
jgi:hypothetical protein